jgi:hypothetical protein
MGGFDEWVRIVGRAVALDPEVGPHFLGNVEESWETEDSEALEWEEFLSSWYERFHDAAVTSKDLNNEVRRDPLTDLRRNDGLYDALPAVLAEAVDKAAFGTQLGTALNQHRDTRYGDEEYRLERLEKDTRTHVVRWKVVKNDA